MFANIARAFDDARTPPVIVTSKSGDTSKSKQATFILTDVVWERLAKLPNPTKVSDAELRAVAEPLFGKKVSVEDLRHLATAMENKFRSAGYPYVRVILPPQEIKNGLVSFSVIEGWIEDVTVLGDASVEKAQTAFRLRALDHAGPVEVDDIERTVALLQRVPGLQSHVSIARGTDGPGAMKLVADATRRPPKYLLNVQNFGSKSLGREGATIYAAIPGAAPYGDQIEIAAYNTFQIEEQSSAQLKYERGLTADGLAGHLTTTYARAKPSGPVAVLGLASESVTADVGLSYPLYLRRKTSLDASIGFAYANFTGELFDGAVPFSDDRTRSVYVGLDGKTKANGWTVAGGAQLSRGVDVLRASEAGDSNLARPEAVPNALITRANLNVATPSFFGIHADARFSGQYSARPLMAIDEFSFGNYTIVRGYDPGAAAGDSAVGLAFDVSAFRQSFWEQRLGAELIGFYDFGRYWNHDSTGTAQRSISSVGGGVRVTLSGKVRADVTYAVPLEAPLGQGEATPPSRILFSLTTDLAAVWEEVADAW